jgi:hypothetical protein
MQIIHRVALECKQKRRKWKKKIRKYGKIYTIVFIIFFISVSSIIFYISFYSNNEFFFRGGQNDRTLVSSFAQTLVFLGSVIIVGFQLYSSGKVERAQFIAELNRSYVENKDYVKLYNALQECWDGKCPYGDGCNREDLKDLCRLPFQKSIVSNYLTFFETVYVLQNDGAISFDDVDDLFAYRFFLAVHSKFVQQQKLQCTPHNFRNIFNLDDKWSTYRIEIKKRTEEDGKYIDEMKVCNHFPLKDLCSESEYADFTKR